MANVSEGTLVEGIQIIGIQSLRHLQEVLSQDNWEDMDLGISGNINRRTFKPEYLFDFKEICGQSVLRRAAEVAAAGRHGLLMCGSAGTGKSMVAKRIPTILPALSWEEKYRNIKDLQSLPDYFPRDSHCFPKDLSAVHIIRFHPRALQAAEKCLNQGNYPLLPEVCCF